MLYGVESQPRAKPVKRGAAGNANAVGSALGVLISTTGKGLANGLGAAAATGLNVNAAVGLAAGIGAASGNSFIPTMISGLQLWLDAADASTVTIDVRVGTWVDKSGAGLCANVTQSIGSSQPAYNAGALNGLHTIGFDGSDDILMNKTTSALLRNVSGYTAFLVGKFSNNGDIMCIDIDGAGSARLAFQPGRSTSGKMALVARRLDADTAAVLEEPSAFGSGYGVFTGLVKFSTTTGTLYEGTTSVATSSSFLTSGNSSNDFGAIGVGGNAFPSTFCNCSVAEIVVYGAALSSTDIATVQNYLKAKWGL